MVLHDSPFEAGTASPSNLLRHIDHKALGARFGRAEQGTPLVSASDGGFFRRSYTADSSFDAIRKAAFSHKAAEYAEKTAPKKAESPFKKLVKKVGSVSLLPALKDLKQMHTHVETVEEANAIPLLHQGDEEHYTEEAIRKRQALRKHPEIVELLDKFWLTTKASDERAANGHDPHITYVRKTGYVLMSMKLYKAIVEEWDEQDAYQTALTEWNEDAEGADTLGRSFFDDAIFGVADMWTGGVDATEYVEFLRELWTRVAHGTSELDYRWKPYPLIEYWPRQLALASDPDQPLSPPQRSARRQSKEWHAAGQAQGKGGATSEKSQFSRSPAKRASPNRPGQKRTPASKSGLAEEAAPAQSEALSSSSSSPRFPIQQPVASRQLPPTSSPLPIKSYSPQQNPPPPSLVPMRLHSNPPFPPRPPVNSPELRRLGDSRRSVDSDPYSLRAYWMGDVVHGSWAVRIERCRLNTGFMFIGVSDFHGSCAWGLHPFSGLLYRLCRQSDGRYSFNSPPPEGYPDGNLVRVMHNPTNLQGRVRGAIIETIVNEDAGVLSFSINGGPPLAALSGFPRGTQLRQWSFVCDKGDRVTPIRVVRVNDRGGPHHHHQTLLQS